MSGIILTAPKSGWRVWVGTPKDAYEQIVGVLEDGYTFDEMEWEVM